MILSRVRTRNLTLAVILLAGIALYATTPSECYKSGNVASYCVD